ncbi:MAG: hypothetical protein PSX36_12930 [bacterium]|nr:hypothetical protein [bacterium]
MGHIKEPNGVDFTVDPTPITEKEKNRISEIIAYYKATGRKKVFQKDATHKKRKLPVT